MSAEVTKGIRYIFIAYFVSVCALVIAFGVDMAHNNAGYYVVLFAFFTLIVFFYLSVALKFNSASPRNRLIISHYHYTPNKTGEIWEWCKENCRGRWNTRYPLVYFSRKSDAALFKLFYTETKINE